MLPDPVSVEEFMKHWLVVDLLLTQELSEALSNFLIEKGATGIEEIDEDSKRKRLKAFFQKDGKEKKVLRDLHRYLESLHALAPRVPRIQLKTTLLSEQRWGENWKRYFRPIRISRFVVKPPWSRIRMKRNQIPIEITPGMAFGTGTHATTQLCLQALEKYLKQKGLSVLDAGTGSGILSIAAARLGAGEVLGLDIDEEAVRIAKENVEKNQVSDRVNIRSGRIGEIRKRFDAVLANIDLKGLMRMKRSLIHHLKDQGILILSGILRQEREQVRQHYLETAVFQWVKVAQKGEWICLTFKKK
jgi:ribosomal protein L11 methyltransferase